MSGLMFAVVLLGCADSGDDCRTIDANAAMFETRAACVAQIEDVLNSDAALRADFPTVMASCQRRTIARAPAAPKAERERVAAR